MATSRSKKVRQSIKNNQYPLQLVKLQGNAVPEQINKRILQIRFNMEMEKVDAIYIAHLPNIRYISNYSGSAAAMLILPDEIHFFTDDRYEEQVKLELYPLHNLTVHITRNVWGYILENKLLNNVQTLGIEDEYLTYAEATNIRGLVHSVGSKFKAVTSLVERFTQPKTLQEVESIKKSCAISEQVYEYILGFIQPGMTELDVAAELEYKARKLGSEGTAFDTIVTAGPRIPIIHGQPSNRKIRKNDILLMDFGSKVNGFCSDITRTVCIGKPTTEQKKIYSIVNASLNAAIDAVRPTMKGHLLDAVARNIIKDEGYGDNFQHSLGHGLGIICHERPTISFRMQEDIIPENVVLALEPGIYLPDKFGVRIEDDVLVANNETIRLTNAPSELICI